MAAPAQRTPVPGPSPDWNVAGRVTQACRPYAATEGREDVSWLASRESTEVSWRVLQAGDGGRGWTSAGRAGHSCGPFASFQTPPLPVSL